MQLIWCSFTGLCQCLGKVPNVILYPHVFQGQWFSVLNFITSKHTVRRLAIFLICFYKTSILPSTFISTQPITHQVYTPLQWFFLQVFFSFSFIYKFIFSNTKKQNIRLILCRSFHFSKTQRNFGNLVTNIRIYTGHYWQYVWCKCKKRWMIFSRLISMGLCCAWWLWTTKLFLNEKVGEIEVITTKPCFTCWLSLTDSQLSKTVINPGMLTALWACLHLQS